ncbi:MAG: AbrB/MazE/SpoVT family DNA-binding domain-containing protein [Nanoarchaeota archaeon]
MIIKREIGEKGQIVIPKDIRRHLGLNAGTSVIFEVKDNEVIMKKENPKEILEKFFTAIKKKKNITLEELRKIEEESYDLP